MFWTKMSMEEEEEEEEEEGEEEGGTTSEVGIRLGVWRRLRMRFGAIIKISLKFLVIQMQSQKQLDTISKSKRF